MEFFFHSRPPKLSAFIRRMDAKRNKNRTRKNNSENNVNNINNCRVQLDDEIDNDEAEKKDFSKDDEAAKVGEFVSSQIYRTLTIW